MLSFRYGVLLFKYRVLSFRYGVLLFKYRVLSFKVRIVLSFRYRSVIV